MDIELTTDGLRKSCRICLGQGELNMWKHTIFLKDEADYEIKRNLEISVVDLFKIYENFNNSLLDLEDELTLLCYSCLDELTNSYLFYKKALRGNIQIQGLYEEAQKIEADQLVDMVVEVLDNDCSDETNVDVEKQAYSGFELVDETRSLLEDNVEHMTCVEQQEVEESSGASCVNSTAIYQTEEVCNKNVTDLSTFDDIEEDRQCTLTATDLDEIKPTIIRQQRNKTHSDKASCSTLLPHEEGALVVTQFLPSTAHILLEKTNITVVTTEDEGGGESIQVTPKLNTVNYAAVEIKSSNLQEVIEKELHLQNTKPLSPECGYGNKDQLQEPMNSVYFCQFCPQAFAAPDYLIAHVRKSHVCKYCTQAFTKSMDLFVHIRQAHHQHKCAICNKELSSHSNLRGHIKRVHGIRLPAQVALLDYRPPNSNAVEMKPYSSSTVDTIPEEMNMYF